MVDIDSGRHIRWHPVAIRDVAVDMGKRGYYSRLGDGLYFMITATCTTTDCQWHDVPRNVFGEPETVKCGGCRQPTTISDPRPDPPMPEEVPQ